MLSVISSGVLDSCHLCQVAAVSCRNDNNVALVVIVSIVVLNSVHSEFRGCWVECESSDRFEVRSLKDVLVDIKVGVQVDSCYHSKRVSIKIVGVEVF